MMEIFGNLAPVSGTCHGYKVQFTSMDGRMQCFHSSSKHLWCIGNLRDITAYKSNYPQLKDAALCLPYCRSIAYCKSYWNTFSIQSLNYTKLAAYDYDTT